MRPFIRIAILALLVPLSFFFTNCTTNLNQSVLNQNQNNLGTTSDLTSVNLSNGLYKFLDKEFKTSQYKIIPKDGSAPIYAQWVSNCHYKCPTVIIANPYSGIDWTDDSIDQQWVRLANAYSGIFINDSLGPQTPEIDPSLGNIFFQAQTTEQSASMGALFLTNNVSVLIVNSRFYRGRNLKIYVEEFKKTVQYFVQNEFVDQNKMAFWGASLGGFITSYASIQTPYKPKVLALLTPLLDLKNQYQYTDDVLTYTNKTDVQNSYKDFFAPYKRRILDFTQGSPAQKPNAFEPFTLDYLAANLKTDTLTIHDTWDTLVPAEQSLKLVNLLNSNKQNVSLLLHQHATAINWDTFQRDHSQSQLGEGYSNESSYLFFSSFILNRILPQTQNKILLYDFNKVSQTLTEIKAAQNRGQNIKWIKNHFLELCDSQNTLVDYTQTIGSINGRYFVQQVMKNIWSLDKSEDQICAEIDTFFN